LRHAYLNFKTKLNSRYRPPSTLLKYNSDFRRNTTFKDFPKEYTYPINIGRGIHKKNIKISDLDEMFKL